MSFTHEEIVLWHVLLGKHGVWIVTRWSDGVRIPTSVRVLNELASRDTGRNLLWDYGLILVHLRLVLLKHFVCTLKLSPISWLVVMTWLWITQVRRSLDQTTTWLCRTKSSNLKKWVKLFELTLVTKALFDFSSTFGTTRSALCE